MSDQKPETPEQTQWEVIDTDGPQQRQQQEQPPRASRATMMRAMLGPWWRWKIAGVTVIFVGILALMFAMAGVLFVVGAVVVLLSLVVAKVRQWLRQSGSSLTR